MGTGKKLFHIGAIGSLIWLIGWLVAWEAFVAPLQPGSWLLALKALPFMRGKPWIRHDEHYQVDFGVPCKPFDS